MSTLGVLLVDFKGQRVDEDGVDEEDGGDSDGEGEVDTNHRCENFGIGEDPGSKGIAHEAIEIGHEPVLAFPF